MTVMPFSLRTLARRPPTAHPPVADRSTPHTRATPQTGCSRTMKSAHGRPAYAHMDDIEQARARFDLKR
jgi:hypothetical protein